MTLEEAQEQILQQQQQIADLTTERDTLSQNNATLTTERDNLRSLNQKYFNRLIAQEEKPKDKLEDKPEDVQSCEEFAGTLKEWF